MSDVFDSYEALQQAVMKPTRKDEILDIIITDLHTSYHAPLPLPPLQVDEDKVGKDSDHRIMLFPKTKAALEENINTLILGPYPSQV